MIWPRPQPGAKVPDALHAGLVLDLAEELEGLNAKLAGLVDLSLVDGIPTVPQVLAALRPNFVMGRAWMAQEFKAHNDRATQSRFEEALGGAPLSFEPHVDFKKRVPLAIGLIRTGETVQYANLILESA